jgi:hypothetical protein
MTSIGKPYEGKPHVRFDEEGLVSPALHSTHFFLRHRPKLLIRDVGVVILARLWPGCLDVGA